MSECFHVKFSFYGFMVLKIDWLFTVLVPLNNFSLIWRRHHCRWRAAKFGPMFGAQGLWAGRDLSRATPAVTRGLGFFRSHPKDHPIQSPLTTHEGMWRIYSNPNPHGAIVVKNKIFKWPHPILTFLWLSPLWRGPGPLFEQNWIPFTQRWFVPSLIDFGRLVLEKKIFFKNFSVHVFLLFRYYLPLENGYPLPLKQTWTPFTQG
jgi:hypothetical protein